MEIYPSHVVVSWIGHSEKVARKHYLQTTDAHFELAVTPKPAELVASSETETPAPAESRGHRQGHEPCEMVKTEEPPKQENPTKHRGFAGLFG